MWMLCSLEKFLPRSSLAWWALKPLWVPGKRIPSTMHIWTWIWTVCQPWPPDLTQGLFDQPCLTEVQWHVPQWLEQWIVCRPVHGWQHAVVLGPDAWWQRRCGLSLLQISGHHKSQSEIRQALVGDHHTDSLCSIWWHGGCRCLPFSDYNAFDWQLQ